MGRKVLFLCKTSKPEEDNELTDDHKLEVSSGDVTKIEAPKVNWSLLQASSFDHLISFTDMSNCDSQAEVLSKYLSVLKPTGLLSLYEQDYSDALKSVLILNGFESVAVTFTSKAKYAVVSAKKPNFEVGSSCALKLGSNVSKRVENVWKLDDTVDDDIIEADDLLNEDDLAKPDPTSLRVCGTTGKRKACKDCSCGLAEELAGEAAPPKPSSCGSVRTFLFLYYLNQFFLVLFRRCIPVCFVSLFGYASLQAWGKGYDRRKPAAG